MNNRKSARRAKIGTLARPEVLLRGFLFAMKALIYFAIFAELVLLMYVLAALA